VFNGAAAAFGVDQAGGSLHVFVVRGLAGIVSHALFSAIFCTGLMWVLSRVPGERRVARGVLTMLTAMAFHFTWDDMGGLSGGTNLYFVLLAGFAAIELAVLFLVRRQAAGTERAWTRDLLAPEVGTGTVEPGLLAAVSGLRKDRRLYRKQVRSRRQSRHLIEAAHDLAHELALAGGAETPRVAHARAELARLRQAA
jgi:hypothetical protein